MRGRKPKPLETHKRNGNPSRLKLVEIEATLPEIPEGDVECPSWLDTYAREAWQFYYPTLKAMGIMKPVYAGALSEMCAALGDVRLYREAMKEMRVGKKYPDIHIRRTHRKKGEADVETVCALPYERMARNASLLAHRWMVEFGLTPSSLIRLGIAGGGQDDGTENWLFG